MNSTTRYGRRQAYSEGSVTALELPLPRDSIGFLHIQRTATSALLHTVASSEGSDEAQGLGLELTPRLLSGIVGGGEGSGAVAIAPRSAPLIINTPVSVHELPGGLAAYRAASSPHRVQSIGGNNISHGAAAFAVNARRILAGAISKQRAPPGASTTGLSLLINDAASPRLSPPTSPAAALLSQTSSSGYSSLCARLIACIDEFIAIAARFAVHVFLISIFETLFFLLLSLKVKMKHYQGLSTATLAQHCQNALVGIKAKKIFSANYLIFFSIKLLSIYRVARPEFPASISMNSCG